MAVSSHSSSDSVDPAARWVSFFGCLFIVFFAGNGLIFREYSDNLFDIGKFSFTDIDFLYSVVIVANYFPILLLVAHSLMKLQFAVMLSAVTVLVGYLGLWWRYSGSTDKLNIYVLSFFHYLVGVGNGSLYLSVVSHCLYLFNDYKEHRGKLIGVLLALQPLSALYLGRIVEGDSLSLAPFILAMLLLSSIINFLASLFVGIYSSEASFTSTLLPCLSYFSSSSSQRSSLALDHQVEDNQQLERSTLLTGSQETEESVGVGERERTVRERIRASSSEQNATPRSNSTTIASVANTEKHSDKYYKGVLDCLVRVDYWLLVLMAVANQSGYLFLSSNLEEELFSMRRHLSMFSFFQPHLLLFDAIGRFLMGVLLDRTSPSSISSPLLAPSAPTIGVVPAVATSRTSRMQAVFPYVWYYLPMLFNLLGSLFFAFTGSVKLYSFGIAILSLGFGSIFTLSHFILCRNFGIKQHALNSGMFGVWSVLCQMLLTDILSRKVGQSVSSSDLTSNGLYCLNRECLQMGFIIAACLSFISLIFFSLFLLRRLAFVSTLQSL